MVEEVATKVCDRKSMKKMLTEHLSDTVSFKTEPIIFEEN